jgi:hypothetical protein
LGLKIYHLATLLLSVEVEKSPFRENLAGKKILREKKLAGKKWREKFQTIFSRFQSLSLPAVCKQCAAECTVMYTQICVCFNVCICGTAGCPFHF